MKTPLPRVSVVVLTHNRLRMLRDAVRTLQEQDYPPELLEIIVVNDGSRDGTREWLDRQQSADPRLRAVHQEPRGIPAARNAGIRASGGDLVAIVADDYLMAPDYVKTFVSFLQEHPEAGVVRFGIIPASRWPGSLVSHFYYEVCFRRRLQQPRLWPEGASRMEKLRTYFRRLPKAPEGLSTNNMLEAAGAAAFRKEVFDRVGLFDETIKRGEDTDMSIRMRKEGIVMVYDPSHKIRHRYGRWGGDTLKKTFMAGIYVARLHAKLMKQDQASAPRPENLLHCVFSLISNVRQADNFIMGVLLFPGLLLIESAWYAGYLVGRSRLK